MNKRFISFAALITAAAMTLSGCGSYSAVTNSLESSDLAPSASHDAGFSDDDYLSSVAGVTSEPSSDTSSQGATSVIFSGTSATVSGFGATASSGRLIISEPGEYLLSGIFDGQIIVDCDDKNENVILMLNGVTVTSGVSAALWVKDASKAVLSLCDGSQNSFTDATDYSYESDDYRSAGEPNACIYSKDDLTINGGGSLYVNGNFANGIQSSDKLKITSGTITVDAVNNGIKGKDCVAVSGGAVIITSGNDGIKSDNSEDTALGFVEISGGSITIVSQGDGISGCSAVIVRGGTTDIKTGGGSSASSSSGKTGFWGQSTSQSDSVSAKGIKAETDLLIYGGNITIDSADDALHSNKLLTVSGGTLTVSSGDDGFHADSALSVEGGETSILKSYEGIESMMISISGGTTYVTASDDGINAGGGDGSSTGGRPGQNPFSQTASGSYGVVISGGYTVINADGDGLDSNGTITMSAGTVIVNGPTNNGNGAIDYNNSYIMNGGLLIAAGASGMAQAVSANSTQYCISFYCSAQSGGTIVRIADSDGKEVFCFAPAKSFSSLVVCSPELKSGSYSISLGGSYSSASVDGLYSGGSYSGGTDIGNFTVSSTVTRISYGNSGSTGGGFGGRR